ncbi:hypothetical protein TKK_0013376 [Trichogramma kaykai]|uniref:Uncharacterized protein n=1 Tax=Trichogramma kaykai TaxID=54128 RepID=A0ABD2WIS3_9HYME
MHRFRSYISRKRFHELSPSYLRRLNRTLDEARKNDFVSRQTESSTSMLTENPIIPDTETDSAQFYSTDNANDDDVEMLYRENLFSSNDDDDDDSSSQSSCTSSDTSISSLEEPDTLLDFEKRLGDVFESTNMTHVQMKKILDVLHTHPCFHNLPKDPRTILKTPRVSAPITLIAGGEYLHLGLEEAVSIILNSTSQHLIPPELLVDFFTDEAALDRNSNIRIWPIEIRISNIDRCKPETVGVWKGDIKPTDPVQLMKPFVDDTLSVINSGGVFYNDIQIPLRIRCFIADSPARAFIIGHLNHNGRFPCSKCWVQGEYLTNSRVMVFKGVDHSPRSSQSYRDKIDGEHHKEGEGSLDRLPMDLVSQTVFEYMHLCCIGVMEKILAGIVSGKYAERVHLSKEYQMLLEARLSEVTKFCPVDFARKPFKIQKHTKFKATEYRQIMLYSGSSTFSGLVQEDAYRHYLLFNAAMRIFIMPEPSEDLLDAAENFIKIFVIGAEKVYGSEFITYVTHGLLHLIEDVRNFGPLDSYSAFPYENHMSFFRRVCRKRNHHLQQIFNRRQESHRNIRKLPESVDLIKVKGEHYSRPLVELPTIQDYRQFSSLEYKSMTLNLKNSDNTVLIDDNQVAIIKNIIQFKNQDCTLLVNRFHSVEGLYTLGDFDSSCVGMFKVNSLSKDFDLVPIESIKAKCFRMPFWSDKSSSLLPENGQFVVATLLSSSS